MFSYSEYVNMMDIIKKSGKLAAFDEALHRDKFVIMRHDVEFSVSRAYNLAKLEYENNFVSNYFFQVANNAYNVFSRPNADMINKIIDMGHKVGLHFHLNGRTDLDLIKQAVIDEFQMLKTKIPFVSPIFSFHRPTQNVLAANIHIDGLLNAYQNDFFSFVYDINSTPPPK